MRFDHRAGTRQAEQRPASRAPIALETRQGVTARTARRPHPAAVVARHDAPRGRNPTAVRAASVVMSVPTAPASGPWPFGLYATGAGRSPSGTSSSPFDPSPDTELRVGPPVAEVIPFPGRRLARAGADRSIDRSIDPPRSLARLRELSRALARLRENASPWGADQRGSSDFLG